MHAETICDRQNALNTLPAAKPRPRDGQSKKAQLGGPASVTSTIYSGSCHCGAIRFRFKSEAITVGFRCNCSICIRKGIVMSSKYISPADFEQMQGEESLAVYQFGDKDVRHCFCRTCGICPFNVVASVPSSYQGPAKPGDLRVNLGCIDGLDPLALEISIIDGRSF
jgi:hypothetical protein